MIFENFGDFYMRFLVKLIKKALYVQFSRSTVLSDIDPQDRDAWRTVLDNPFKGFGFIVQDLVRFQNRPVCF